ncbi:HNH endonuclease [Streptomyces sp. JNUCC 63]
MGRRKWPYPAPDGQAWCRVGPHLAGVGEMKRHARGRDGFDTICREHNAADDRARYAADPEKKRAADRARRAADNAAGICAWSGCHADAEPGWARCAEHTEANRADCRARYAKNAARTDEQIAARRAELRPDGTKRCRSCRRTLPLDAFNADRTRADGLNVECRDCANGDLWRAALPHVVDADLYACVYCGADAEHVDHVAPRKLGGTDDAHNLVPACADCNLSKNATPVIEWLARRDPWLLDAVASWPVEVIADAA